MSEPFLGQLALFPYNFVPKGWVVCDGSRLQISSNQALFSLLGTTFGGNGTTTFGLPDLRGRVANGQGTGPGLSPYVMGHQAGAQTVALTTAQLAGHSHDVRASPTAATTANPTNNPLAEAVIPGRSPVPVNIYAGTTAGTATTLAPEAIASSGGGQAHNNEQPSLVLEWCIALQGVFPSRG